MKSNPAIGMIAPSSVVPKIQLLKGVERLRESGFSVSVHPQCLKKHLFFAGTDEERASALLEFAFDPRTQVLWSARGGYGSVRILSELLKQTRKKGNPPKKLLVGFSDSTALLEFVRSNWGWSILHAPMPGLKGFEDVSDVNWKNLIGLVGETKKTLQWSCPKLKFLSLKREVTGQMIGGNLSVMASLIGTPYELNARGKILFLEDVDESFYRLDRMMTQLVLSGSLSGVKALVLGNFHRCEDRVPKTAPPLRKSMSLTSGLMAVFGTVGAQLKIPVVMGLPVGHGEAGMALPLGAEYHLSATGRLELLRWNGLKKN